MKKAFLFSGQGAQYPGMLKNIYDESEKARRIFSIADEVLGRSITDICFNSDERELSLTQNTQPCLLTVEIAAYEALIEAKGIPDAVAGFSLGEYSALVAAGVLSFEDAIKLVQIRADAMQKAVPKGQGAMAAVMCSDNKLLNGICNSVNGYVAVANYNCPDQTVVSGEKVAIKEFCKICKDEGIKATRLPVSAPFHCKLMEPAVVEIEEYLSQISMKDANMPVYMNVDSMPETDAVKIRDKLLRQTVSPVRWEDTVINMFNDGINEFFEIGPGDTLARFNDIIFKGKNIVNGGIDNC